MDRISSLHESRYDVIIIGGGINGASAAQHLTADGYTVALFEKNDFASGTTSRSSRLLHWGVRFLAPKKSAMEHVKSPGGFLKRLKSARKGYADWHNYGRTIPEYLHPIKLSLPFWNDYKVAGWQLDAGCFLVGGYGCRARVNYKRYPTGTLPAIGPKFASPEKLRNVVEFDDYQFVWPERICIDAILDAERMGAVVRNYTRVDKIARNGDGWSVTVSEPESGTQIVVHANAVVNTTGAWTDDLVKQVQIQDKSKVRQKVMRTKGVHLMARLPASYKGRGVIDRNVHGGSLFALPWGDYHYIGPTETVYTGSPDEVVPDENDISFLLEQINSRLSDLKLKREDILFGWAGLRPSTYREGYPLGDNSVFGVVHDMTHEGLPKFYAVTWGTVNQHRATSSDLVSKIKGSLAPSGTKRALSYKPRSDLGPKVIYGGLRVIDPAVIISAIRDEHAKTLRDVLFGRTPFAWGPWLTKEFIRSTADVMGKELNWSESVVIEKCDAFLLYLKKFHLYNAA